MEDEGEEQEEECRRECETPIRYGGEGLMVEGKQGAGGNPDVCVGL